ncbi:MAG: DUF5702 domain-containing protein [Lachnospiraceae bacterium]|nr:DUF5702 domain-containing protein [Lachnospiraceae bacterium]
MTVPLYKLFSDSYKKGEITVFLSLILASLLGLMSVLIESARLSLMRMNIESVMDSAIHSCFGEYDRKLYDRYDLLFIDSSYRGENSADIENVASHLAGYINVNVDYTDTKANGEWYREKLCDVTSKGYVFASDNNGEVFKEQAMRYIEKYAGYKNITGINMSRPEIEGIRKTDFFSEWDSLLAAVDAYGLPLMNPGKIVRGMVLKPEEFLKGCTLNNIGFKDIPSKRSLNQGNSLNKIKKYQGTEDAFVEYLMQKCGCFTEKNTDQQLNAELEYIVYGYDNDKDNMCCVLNNLMEIRESDNLRCIKGDAGKMEQAWKKAVEIVMFHMIDPLCPPDPVLIRLVRDTIIYAWAYAESAIDVSRLLNRGLCQVNKSSADISLSLRELLNFKSKLNGSGGSGISYKTYIGVFVSQTADMFRRERCMDIIEVNCRVFHNSSFRIDGCVEYFEAKVKLTSGYGYSHEITRDFYMNK